MKKIGTVIIACVMLMSLLSACGGDSEEATQAPTATPVPTATPTPTQDVSDDDDMDADAVDGIVVTGDSVFTFGPYVMAIPDGWEYYEESSGESDTFAKYFIADPNEVQGTLMVFAGKVAEMDELKQLGTQYIANVFPGGIETTETENVNTNADVTITCEALGGYDENGKKVVVMEYFVTDQEEYVTFIYSVMGDVYAASEPNTLTSSFLSLQVVQ